MISQLDGLIFQEQTIQDGQQITSSYQIQDELIIDADKDYQIVKNIHTGELFTSRILSKSCLVKTKQRQNLINEIKITKSLQAPNILNFKRVFEDQSHVYILYEYFSEQKTLDKLVKQGKKFTEQEIRNFLSQMVIGLKYLQDSLVIHRNLKLKNIFINQRQEIKIGGFQYATKLNSIKEKKFSICGQQNYLAPEILLNEGYSFEVDIWALGNIVYALYIGQFPYNCKDIQTTYNKIKKNDLNFPENIEISHSLLCLITNMLDSNPNLRPTLQEIISHQFMIGNDKNTNYDQKIMNQ
ncbi:Serine/threonine-protein kinase plk1 [Paramecium bursaria]